MNIKEGMARVIRKGEVIIFIDEDNNLFQCMEMLLFHVTKDKMEEAIKKAKEKK